MSERKAYADRHLLSHLGLSGKSHPLTKEQHGQIADLLWNDLFPEDEIEESGWFASDYNAGIDGGIEGESD